MVVQQQYDSNAIVIDMELNEVFKVRKGTAENATLLPKLPIVMR